MFNATSRTETKVFLTVFLIALGFAVYTQHAWEDYWITFRASRNLATGQGLVYTPGERLHTFTSPLGVLLPAATSWVTGNKSDELALWLFRLISISFLAAGLVVLFKILQTLIQNPLMIFFTMTLLVLDSKTVDFSINGMETGLLIFSLALTLHGLLLAGPRQILRIGLGWAGLMWSRPDSCVYIAALGLGALIFLPSKAPEKTRLVYFKTLLSAAGICTVLYLPWFSWSWWYYGSPVPYTIVAKGTNTSLDVIGIVEGLFFFPFIKSLNASPLWGTFIPAYAGGDWPRLLRGVALFLAWVAALSWVCPLIRPQTRVLSFSFFLGQVYLCDVIKVSYPWYQAYPWYLPTVAVMGYLVIGLMLDQLLCLVTRLPELGWNRGWFHNLALWIRVTAIALMLGQAMVFLCVCRQMQVEQELIENGVRRQIGLWLRDHARSTNDNVMLEPLGYIGYFSGLRTYDYPGLSSKKVVEVRRRLGPSEERKAYLELKPDWLVLRPREIRGEGFIDPTGLDEFYEPAVVADVSDRIRAIHWLPGRGLITFDQKFVVLHRKNPSAPLP